MFDIEKFLDLTGYEETRKDRRKSKEINSQEFFTPYSIVKRMADKIPDEDWSNDKSTTIKGILKLCNVPNDKIDFYIKHIKDTINEFDSYNKK